MVRSLHKKRSRIRTWIQMAFFAVTNGYVQGWLGGKIYTGPLKAACVPGLNCYSCPGAFGSCPIGSLQAVAAGRDFRVSLYVLGFLTMIGAVFGRFVCGWLCPFGLFQDLLHKIPFWKKLRTIRGERYLRLIKYVILAVFVILLPMVILNAFGQGEPWFCKWICPSGTFMAGWPLVILNQGIRQAVGLLFAWKSLILIALILMSVIIYRPFCRFLCPLGAMYGLFNPISLYRYRIDEKKCTNCMDCQTACKLNIPVREKPNSMECIRCGECKKVCKNTAIF